MDSREATRDPDSYRISFLSPFILIQPSLSLALGVRATTTSCIGPSPSAARIIPQDAARMQGMQAYRRRSDDAAHVPLLPLRERPFRVRVRIVTHTVMHSRPGGTKKTEKKQGEAGVEGTEKGAHAWQKTRRILCPDPSRSLFQQNAAVRPVGPIGRAARCEIVNAQTFYPIMTAAFCVVSSYVCVSFFQTVFSPLKRLFLRVPSPCVLYAPSRSLARPRIRLRVSRVTALGTCNVYVEAAPPARECADNFFEMHREARYVRVSLREERGLVRRMQ